MKSGIVWLPVRGEENPSDGQAGAPRHECGHRVPEIAGGDDERERPAGRAEVPERGEGVVGRLGQEPAETDAVRGGERNRSRSDAIRRRPA